MFDRLLSIFIAALVLAGGTVALFLYAYSEPSTVELDKDIQEIRSRIEEATKEAKKYESGLVKALIEVRNETLKVSEDMLRAKRYSLIRRINLQYVANGNAPKTKPLETIEKDIEDVEKRILEASSEAAQYSGGLLHSLLLAKIATEQVSLAQLRLAYYSSKYGLGIPTIASLAGTPDSSTKPAGRIVSDKDAL